MEPCSWPSSQSTHILLFASLHFTGGLPSILTSRGGKPFSSPGLVLLAAFAQTKVRSPSTCTFWQHPGHCKPDRMYPAGPLTYISELDTRTLEMVVWVGTPSLGGCLGLLRAPISSSSCVQPLRIQPKIRMENRLHGAFP